MANFQRNLNLWRKRIVATPAVLRIQCQKKIITGAEDKKVTPENIGTKGEETAKLTGSKETLAAQPNLQPDCDGDDPSPVADWDFSNLETNNPDEIASKAVPKKSGNSEKKHPTIPDNLELTNEEILSESTPKTNLPYDKNIINVLVGNIAEDTTKEELIQLLGLRTTLYLRNSVRIKLISDSGHDFKRYALIQGPREIMNQLVSKCNPFEFRKRKLVIEFENSDRSVLLYGKRDLQQKGCKGRSAQTSGYKRKMGGSRPASSASSRPEESAPCTNREQGEFGELNPEVVGGGANTLNTNDRTMAQHIRQA